MWKKEDLLMVLLMEKLQYMFISFVWLLWYLVRHKHEIPSLHRSHTQLPNTIQPRDTNPEQSGISKFLSSHSYFLKCTLLSTS